MAHCPVCQDPPVSAEGAEGSDLSTRPVRPWPGPAHLPLSGLLSRAMVRLRPPLWAVLPTASPFPRPVPLDLISCPHTTWHVFWPAMSMPCPACPPPRVSLTWLPASPLRVLCCHRQGCPLETLPVPESSHQEAAHCHRCHPHGPSVLTAIEHRPQASQPSARAFSCSSLS